MSDEPSTTRKNGSHFWPTTRTTYLVSMLQYLGMSDLHFGTPGTLGVLKLRGGRSTTRIHSHIFAHKKPIGRLACGTSQAKAFRAEAESANSVHFWVMQIWLCQNWDYFLPPPEDVESNALVVTSLFYLHFEICVKKIHKAETIIFIGMLNRMLDKLCMHVFNILNLNLHIKTRMRMIWKRSIDTFDYCLCCVRVQWNCHPVSFQILYHIEFH